VKKLFRNLSILVIAITSIQYASCKKAETKDDYADVKGNYFSINQFILDEWNNYQGMPFVIIKTIRVDKGRTDSSYTNSDTINWAPIFYTFSATDISDRKNLGLYNFNQFDDDQDETHNFFYMAKEADQFTQKLLITINQINLKVKGIYIETFKKTVWSEVTQKLYYKPLQEIQIQTDTKQLFGDRKHTVQQWEFLK
jgi:hypothetical protein